MNYTEGLNEMQKKAVLHDKGPALVIAGAGSGKTRVLTRRIAYLIEERKVHPNSILAITFTNKAAKEMKERIAELVDFDINYMWVGTFHSICVRILRRFIEKLGYERNFLIFDADDQKIVVKECILELDLNTKNYNPNAIRGQISNLKNSRISPEEYIKENHSLYRERMIGEIYKLYNEKLKKSNSLDFDDLLLKALELIEKHEDVADYYKNKFEHILVDEYQDTNRVQYLLVKNLGTKKEGNSNVFVVGDEDQSIYGWRGADIQNILDFEKDFPNAEVIKLERNYRSTKNILDAANYVIENNENRIGKNLWTEDDKGSLIQLYEGMDETQEADYIVERIYNERTVRDTPYKDIAILVRTRAQTRAIEDKLKLKGMPYKIVGGQEFYGRKEIKDILAYIKLIQNPHENYSFKRVVNLPRRGIGAKTLETLEEKANEKDISLFQQAEISQDLSISQKAKDSFEEFTDFIKKFKNISEEENMPLDELVINVYEESGYKDHLEKDRETVEGKGRIENIEEFVSAVADFQENNEDSNLEDFLAYISLLTDIDKTSEKDDAITIMTAHAAKGLEFELVFVAGLEEDLFPIRRDDDNEMEEERRLFYVALTRAKKRIYLSYATTRRVFGKNMSRQVSRFIDEIPDDLFDQREIKKNIKQNKLTEKTASRGFYQEKEFFKGYTGISKKDNKNFQERESEEDFKPGDKIAHKKWGQGTVVQVKGSEITVAFNNIGTKVMIMPYAPIKKI
jgi:DNA helicase-2/ATP-dependent DNA helicase PcrA